MAFEYIVSLLKNKLNLKGDFTLNDKIKSLGVDSLDMVELIMDVEEHFGIIVEDDAIINMTTLKDVVDYIESKK